MNTCLPNSKTLNSWVSSATIAPKYTLRCIVMMVGLSAAQPSYAQQTPAKPKTPIMGWSSWNHFRINISEKLIKEQADAMVQHGLKDAGYQFINIDDGFFGGRDKAGNMVFHPTRFPNGIKVVADYIHSKGLKAGIYAEAGINSCASIYDKDTIGSTFGLFGHDEKDLTLLLKTCGFDFLKVDWCGAQVMNLDEELRYTQISNWIKSIKPEVIYNICRWQFPGKWAPLVADSWRISADIDNDFQSILNIINLNANLWPYASPGHFNDMDMLQVGRGMTYEEDKSHFSMWCMMNSPLLLGNDLRTISKKTLSIVTNKELIDLNQDPLCYQARKLQDTLGIQTWAKPLGSSTSSGKVAVALLNTNDKTTFVTLDVNSIGISVKDGYTIRDLWKHENLLPRESGRYTFTVPSHGVVVLVVEGAGIPFNVFEKK